MLPVSAQVSVLGSYTSADSMPDGDTSVCASSQPASIARCLVVSLMNCQQPTAAMSGPVGSPLRRRVAAARRSSVNGLGSLPDRPWVAR